MTEEELETAAQKGLALPDDIKVLDVEFPGRGKISYGDIEIFFYRQGYSDKALIHLEADDTQQVSLLIEPFLPSVRFYEKYAEFEETGFYAP